MGAAVSLSSDRVSVATKSPENMSKMPVIVEKVRIRPRAGSVDGS